MRIKPQPARKLVQRFLREEQGVVAVVIALGLTVLMGFVALAIDVGMLYRERAQLQAKADVSALSAVPDFDEAQARVDNALERNDQNADALVSLELGRFLRNPAIPKDQRFTPLPSGSAGINAVFVTLRKESPLYFAQVFVASKTAEVNAKSTALRTGAASFSLGSHLVRLGDTSLSDALSQSVNAQVELSAGDIDVLTGATFKAGDLLAALSEQIGFDNLNPAEILNQNISPSDLIAALEAVSPVALPSSVSDLSRGVGAPTFSVRDLVSGSDTELGLTTMDLLSETTLSARDVLASLAKPGATGVPVSLDVAASVPGVLDVSTQLSWGEPDAQSGVIAMGEVDVTLHSAAARLKTDIDISPDILGTLGVGVQSTRLNVPLYTELAGTTATLTELSCTGADPYALAAEFETAHSELHPNNGASLAALYLGTLPNDPMVSTGAIDPATLDFADILDISITIRVPLLPDIQLANITLQARSYAAVGQSQTETITFTKGEVASGQTSKTFGTGELLQTAVQNLLSPSNLELRTKPGQSGLGNALVAGVLSGVLDVLPGALLGSLLSPIDSVLDATLSTLGIELGAGELTLTDHLCEVPKLVR